MKKVKLIALTAMLIGVLGLSACNRKKPTPTPVDPDPVDPGKDPIDPVDPKPNPDGTVTVYLDLGEIGLYEGKAGTDYPEVFVENGVKITGNPGDALPGKNKITSTSGAEFSNWMYYKASDKTGAPTRYDVLPEFNCILLANWSGGSGTTPVDPPIEGEVTYTVTDLPNWITNDGCVIFAWVWSPSDSGSWKACSYSDPATSLTFVVDGEISGFLLARCAAGTTLPNWSEKGDVPGRVYNQTKDVTCVSGVHTYSTDWS